MESIKNLSGSNVWRQGKDLSLINDGDEWNTSLAVGYVLSQISCSSHNKRNNVGLARDDAEI